MAENRLLSPLSRNLMALTAAAFGLVGLVLFLGPAWSAPNFAWKISSMVAMTMGGWFLGSAVMAGLVAYRRRWNVIYASLLYVGAFSLTEAVVLVIHAERLRLDAPLAWPYVGALGLAILTSLLVLLDWLRQKPALTPDTAPLARWVSGVILGFVTFVFFLSLIAFSGHEVGLNGWIFPEPLSTFTLQSFGAFYFSLAFSVLAVLRVPRLDAITVHVQGGLALITFITAAALVYLRSFHFADHPLQSIYLGVYLLAFGLAVYYLWNERAHRKDPPAAG